MLKVRMESVFEDENDPGPLSWRERVPWRLLDGVATCAVAATIVFTFLMVSGVNWYGGARLPHLIDGTADRPFVYRVLFPKLVGLLCDLTPSILAERVQELIHDTRLARATMHHIHIAPNDYLAGSFAIVLMFISLVAYKRAFRYLAATYYVEHWTLDLWSYLALLVLPPLYWRFGYFYDFTVLFFGTLLFGLIAREHWISYLMAFTLACLSKETTLVFVLVFAVCARGSLATKSYMNLIFAQLVIFGLIRVALTNAYSSNAGSSFDYHLPDHLRMYSTLTPAAEAAIAGWLLLIAGVFMGFAHKPRGLRWSAIAVVPMLVLYLLFGYPFEWRAFYEVLGPVLLLSFHSLYRLVARTNPELSEYAMH